MSTMRAIYAARREVGIEDDDVWRGKLENITGKRHLTDMTPGDQVRVLQELRKDGATRSKRLDGPYAAKLQALWLSAWNLGIVRDRRDSAMLAFIKRQTGIEHTRFLRDPRDAKKAVEALKQWMTREAKVDWSTSEYRPAWWNNPRAQVVRAQIARLVMSGMITNEGNDGNFLRTFGGIEDAESATDADWIVAQEKLGQLIRYRIGSPKRGPGAGSRRRFSP